MIGLRSAQRKRALEWRPGVAVPAGSLRCQREELPGAGGMHVFAGIGELLYFQRTMQFTLGVRISSVVEPFPNRRAARGDLGRRKAPGWSGTACAPREGEERAREDAPEGGHL